MEDPLIMVIYFVASLALTALLTYFIVDYALQNHTSVYTL